MSESRSTFYQEVQANQNLRRGGLYKLDRRNKILYFLLLDCRVAEELEVCRPIGDHIVSLLKDGAHSEYRSGLNRPGQSFHDDGRWRDPTFVAISFFDIMVTSAAEQGIRWHMWLYYAQSFLELLIGLYDETGADIDRLSEWPTQSAYLIYEIFVRLLGWVLIISDLPTDSCHLSLPARGSTDDNASIPGSAINAFSRVVRLFFLAENIGCEFKESIYSLVIRRIIRFSNDQVQGPFRAALITALIAGDGKPNRAYGGKIATLWQSGKYRFHHDMDDYEEAFRNTYPDLMPGS